MGQREDTIARIKTIQAIRAAESKKAGSGQADLQKLDPLMPADGPIDYAVDATGRALSLPIAWAKGAIGGATGKMEGKEVLDAALGGGPTTSDLASRYGVGTGPKLSDYFENVPKDAPYDMSLRGFLGGLVDAFASPANIKKQISRFSSGAKPTARELRAANANPPAKESILTRAGKSLVMGNAAGDAATNTGRAVYKSAPVWRVPDYNNKRLGKKALSDVGLEHGVWGRASTMPDQFDTVLDNVGDEINRLEAKASRLGVRGDTARDLRPSMDKALEDADLNPKTGAPRINRNASMDPAKRAAAENVVDELHMEALLNPKPDLGRMVKNKRTYDKKAGPEYKDDPKHTLRSELDEQIAHDYRHAIEDLSDQGKPGLGGEIYSANRNYGAVKEANKPLNAAGKQKVNWQPTGGDARMGLLGALMAGVGGGSGAGMLAAATAAAMAGKFAGSNVGRTGVGKLLHKAGKSGLIDPAMRAGAQQYFDLTNTQRPNPWSLYQDGEEK